MNILNRWECDEFELVLFRNDRGVRNGTYGIDINDKKGRETAYYYELKTQKEAEDFFETMWKHIFIK